MAKRLQSSFFSLIFYSLLAIALFIMLLFGGCEEQNNITEPKSTGYFDSSLILFGSFIHSSVPVSILNRVMFSQSNRALIYWYTIMPSDVTVQDILGSTINVSPEFAQVPVLDIVFDPARKGIYNNGQLETNLKDNWSGIFRRLPDEIIRKAQSKNLVMKIWMKIVDAPPLSMLSIDLGQISEDIIPNGKLDTEDKNNNGLLDNREDTGLDGLADTAEPGYNALSDPDPNNDDFSFSAGNNDYSHINGLEGDGVSLDNARISETEDINRNFVLDQSNNYFGYQIPLDVNQLNQTKIIKRSSNGWFQLKIPVDLPDVKVGNFDKSNFGTIRLWIMNADRAVHLRIAEIKFDEL